MVLTLSLRKDLIGMSSFGPKGRRNIPDELLQFGRHLVYSEGTRTEPLYIESIKKEIASKYNCQINDIELIIATKDESFNTIGLIKYGVEDVKKRLEKGEIINHVWFFFDKDDFPKKDFNDACLFEEKANNSKGLNNDGFKYDKETQISYHCCWSNEAFALWLLLYFSYIDSSLNRKDYIKKLEEHNLLKKINFKYTKVSSDIHQVISKAGGSIQNAIKYAKKLVDMNNNQNPSTTVYVFAEYFYAYMNK